MDDAKVMSILDEMDWRDDLNDREVPRDSSHELDTSDEENEAGRGALGLQRVSSERRIRGSGAAGIARERGSGR